MVATDRLFISIDSCSNIEEVREHFPKLDFLTYFYSIVGYYHISTSSIIDQLFMSENEYLSILDGKIEPTRNQVIQLAGAVKLDIKKTNFLLSLANKNILDPKNTRDSIIIFSIKNHYNLNKVESILNSCHFQSIK
ncbi:MAG: hypothetical protein ACI4SR_03615 [Faecalibacillus sp.]